MKEFDVIVLGLGAMGSSTLYQLSKRGGSVLGIDQFSPPHVEGSTHGDTRITRLAIGEGEEYVPLVIRSHEIWPEIERESGKQLRFRTGGLVISSEAKGGSLHVENFFGKTVAAAGKYGIAHEILHASDIRKRFPQFNVADDEIGYFEPEAGYLIPEECVKAQIALAESRGAAVHRNEKVLGFTSDGSKVRVETDRSAYTARDLVITAGAWLPGLIGKEYSQLFKVYRQVLYWFDIQESERDLFAPDRCPIFIWELQGKKHGIYGFPAVDGPAGGVKIATEQLENTTTPETVDPTVTKSEIEEMYETSVAPYFPGLSHRSLRAATCLYTSTAGARFLIDTHPEYTNITIVSPCSGHGFKHSASIGEAVAERIATGTSRLDLTKFSFERLEKG
jgi:sarcosine oxidase